MFAALLVRRIGLAIGAFLFIYYVAEVVGRPTTMVPSGTQVGMAVGAAIVAFFLPKPAFKKDNHP